MLRFTNRFHGHRSLGYVYRNGASVRSHLFSVKSTLNPRRRQPRIAVVVSKKVLKSAVGRNRIRRRLYEIVRHELPQLQQNSDIVILVSSRDVATVPADELRASLTGMLREAGLYQSV